MYVSVPKECPARVLHKRPHECPHKSVLQVLQECLHSDKSVARECPTRAFYGVSYRSGKNVVAFIFEYVFEFGFVGLFLFLYKLGGFFQNLR